MEEKPFASSSSSSSSQPSSSFKPKLNDQDYMELVCENGQILAKGRRSKSNGSFQNQRTQSLLDLYESEYYDGIKKTYIKNLGDTQVVPVSESQPQQDKENDEQMNNNKKKKKITSSKIKFERNVSKSHKRVESSTLINDSTKSPKNVEVTKAPPDEQSAAVGRSTELYFASSSMFSRGTSRDQSFCSFKRKHGDMEEEESTYLSNNSDDESDHEKTQVHVRTRKPVSKRKRSTEVHKLSERKQRDEFNKKLRDLQDLLPNCYKDDKASLLDEAIIYMRTLQLQVQMMMSMRNGLIRPPTMLPLGHYYPMGLGMHMDAAATATSVPQFMPMNVQGTGFQGISNASSQMLSFLNHHSTGLIPNSPIFSPLENCSHQQFIVPSCVPQTQATSFTQLPKSVSTSSLEDAMQFRGSNGYYRSLN